jgi:hypothetical protein
MTDVRNCLQETLTRAQREVASWPQWKRDYYERLVAPPPPDPCVSKRNCDEAQTCVGGCVYRSHGHD